MVMSRRNFALNRDEDYLVLSVSALRPEEIDGMCRVVVETARVLGVLEG